MERALETAPDGEALRHELAGSLREAYDVVGAF
jgi:hypothetical protein